jgi:hypothetical protein
MSINKEAVSFALVALAALAGLYFLPEIVKYLTGYLMYIDTGIKAALALIFLELWDKYGDTTNDRATEIQRKNTAYGLVYLGRAIVVAVVVGAGL